jgi:hypothetical protein
LSEYLFKTDDPSNFPPSELPSLLARYEHVFKAGIDALGTTKETLLGRSDFKIDSGDATNLEGGIAILRLAEALRLQGLLNIHLVYSTKEKADLVREKNGQRVCCEVKAITKQSKDRDGFFLEGQLYERILEHIGKARKELSATAAEQNCSVTIYACVINWFEQFTYLRETLNKFSAIHRG